jgi:hypothetical protein
MRDGRTTAVHHGPWRQDDESRRDVFKWRNQ